MPNTNTPHNWATGDVITAEYLNNMPFVFSIEADGDPTQSGTSISYNVTTSTSYSEISAAVSNGRYTAGLFSSPFGTFVIPIVGETENGIAGSYSIIQSGGVIAVQLMINSEGGTLTMSSVELSGGSSSSSNFVSPTYIIDFDYSANTPINIGVSLTSVKNRLNGTYEGNNGVKQDVIYRMTNGTNYSYYRPIEVESSQCTITRFIGNLGEESYDHSGTQLQPHSPK